MASAADNHRAVADFTDRQQPGWLSRIRAAEQDSHFWASSPGQLITKSQLGPSNFAVGNGAFIYESSILPALETAEQEIIFVTCFWARSRSLDMLNETLINLSQRAIIGGLEHGPKLRVRLCFSSLSLTQKLLHTSSPNGYAYPPSTWVSKLGLPPPERLDGIDLQVKSLFYLPFSVMHPKFVIIDRKRALIPSCNLSWESWLEGCLPLKGPIVDRLFEFWKEIWGCNERLPALNISLGSHREAATGSIERLPTTNDSHHANATTEALASSHTITLLPSPHHRSPRFRPFLRAPPPPPTPLNIYFIQLINNAASSIQILTPNLTSPPVIQAFLDALGRGVNINIITNRRMMVLEQILTAGTLTEICVWRLKRSHKNLVKAQETGSSQDFHLEEGRNAKVGTLKIGYFRTNSQYEKSHIKCTIVDEEIVVLGSGNLDRASWYTSQELGIAIEGADVIQNVKEQIEHEVYNGHMDGERSQNGVDWT